MHPVLVNLLRAAGKGLEEDPEQFVREVKTAARRFKKKIKSKKFEDVLRKTTLRFLGKQMRSFR